MHMIRAALTALLRLESDLEVVAEVTRGDEIVPAPAGTVRNYLTGAITKTGARNKIDAVRIAEDAGWL
ncbi:hypothetical protein [Microbispora triticiradicis]|uniref:hypothetical protein n=1 Tax=Microbispora triticiradicis TaxID=2200763 RepID=UPI001AD7DB20|nr:hypothetical protein [Microbispora triticiradicis]